MKIPLSIALTLLNTLIFSQSSMNVSLLHHWDGEWVDTNNAGIKYNEVWGFVQDNEEYAVIGSVNGTHIFLLSDTDGFVEIDFVPGAYQGHVVHRDYHDNDGYLYAVCDQAPSTLQIIDLQYLPDSVHVVYDSDALINTAHNVFIDSSSSLMYICNPPGTGMEVYSIVNPISPVLVWDHNMFDYIHDVYVRNDSAYLASGLDGLWIYDFSNPSAPVNLGSLTSYPEQGFNHSGWLSEDGKTYVMADETTGKKLKVVDVSDLSDINVLSVFGSDSYPETIPHNVMLFNNIAYVSYYNDGLQMYDISNPANPTRFGWHDTYLGSNDLAFQGAWGIYANLPSGKLLISDRNTGLYVFKYFKPEGHDEINYGVYPNPAKDFIWFYHSYQDQFNYRLRILSAEGKIVKEVTGMHDHLNIDLRNLAAGLYLYELYSEEPERKLSGKFVKEE